VDVEQDDVGRRRLDRVDGFGDVACLGDDPHPVAELGHDSRAEVRMVVDHHDRHELRAHPDVPPSCGSLSEISVPAPGSLRISALPPTRSIRAITDSVSPRLSVATAP
jgi:hypothetical protein